LESRTNSFGIQPFGSGNAHDTLSVIREGLLRLVKFWKIDDGSGIKDILPRQRPDHVALALLPRQGQFRSARQTFDVNLQFIRINLQYRCKRDTVEGQPRL
jgi:hypothetical protein